jgi:hypothetical protein
MRLQSFKIIPLIIFLIAVIGCSGQNPLTDDQILNSPGDYLISDNSLSPSYTGILGEYSLTLDIQSMSAEITPARNSLIGESYIVSGKSFFTTFPCSDCLRVKGLGLDDDENVVVAFTIRHPFPKGNVNEDPSGTNRLDLDLFDLALLVKPSGMPSEYFPKTNKYAYHNTILNNEGYTCELSDMISDQNLIPYKICYESQANNRFEMGTSWHDFDVIFPGSGSGFKLYLTMAYGSSATFQSRLHPIYFVPEFNRKAAWKVKVTPPQGDLPPMPGNTWDDLDTSTPYAVTIDIYDWNHGAVVSAFYPDPMNTNHIRAKSDVGAVTVEIPGMTDSVKAATTSDTSTNGWDDPLTYKAVIANENALASGDYTGLVAVSDTRIPGSGLGYDSLVDSPDGKNLVIHDIPEFKTYQTFKATVVHSTPDPINPTVIGRYRTFGLPYRIDIQNNYACLATQEAESDIVILDITDISEPEIIGRAESTNYINFEAKGDYLFGLYQDDYVNYGIRVVDISDKTNPHIESSIEFIGISMAWGFDIEGNYAYAGCYGDGVKIYNISDPANVVYEGGFSGPATVYGVAVIDNYLYAACDTMLNVINVTNPSSPTYVATANANCLDIEVKGNYAYALHFMEGFTIVDITNPASPVVKGNVSEWLEGAIAVGDDYAYVTNGPDGFYVIDIRNVNDPEIVRQCWTEDAADAMINGNYLFLCDAQGGFKTFNISSPNNPIFFSELKAYNPAKLDSNNRYVFTCERFMGTSIIDRIDPTNPVDLGYVSDDFSYCVVVDGDNVFVGSYDRLMIYNVSNTSSPVEVGNLTLDDSAYEMEKHGDFLYICKFDTGFDIVDVNPVSNPSIVGTFAVVDPSDLSVINDHLYLAQYASPSDYFRVFDITNPASPTQDYEVALDGIRCIETQGSYAYITGYNLGLRIYDIADPHNPAQVGSYPCSGFIQDVEVSGDFAYLPHPTQGLHVVDIRDPANPVQYSSLNSDINIEYVDKVNNMLFGAGHSDGLTVIKLW